jgi:hypothetical protein
MCAEWSHSAHSFDSPGGVGVIVTTVIIAAALQATVAAGPRREYVACLKTAVSQASGQKIAPDGFAAFAQQSCSAIEQNFKAELVKFLTKNGMSKSSAAEDANLQIEDYVYSAEERYRDQVANGGAPQ